MIAFSVDLNVQRFRWLESQQGRRLHDRTVTGFRFHEDGRRGVLLLGREEEERIVEFPPHLRSLEALRVELSEDDPALGTDTSYEGSP